MIALENIYYRYPHGSDFALSDVSFTVQPGKIFTLLGPNGAGKTTLIRILSSLIIPSRGVAKICGFDTVKEEYQARQSFSLVLGDERTFYFRLSGRQNLEFFGGLQGLKRKHLAGRITEVMELVGLQDAASLPFMKYSTGMKKRLNFARALLADPAAYLLDEPNSGIDPETAQHIRQIIIDLKTQGRSILLTTHNLQEAERVSDVIGFLKEGSLRKVGELSQFKQEFRKRKLTVVFDASNPNFTVVSDQLLNRLKRELIYENHSFSNGKLEVSFNGSTSVRDILGIIVESELHVISANCEEANLEDIFLKLARCDHV